MTYYEMMHALGAAHGRFMMATESNDVVDLVVAGLRLAKASIVIGWSPTRNIEFWREVWTDGYPKTCESGMRGAFDGMMKELQVARCS